MCRSERPPAPEGDGALHGRGLLSAAPDQVALHEADHFAGIDLARVSMLSVGTATANYRPIEGADDEQAGAVSWLSDGRLVLTMIAAQQQHAQAMVEDRLGARYLRLDADWPTEAGLGIDVATPEAAATLTAWTEDTLRRIGDRRVSRPCLGLCAMLYGTHRPRSAEIIDEPGVSAAEQLSGSLITTLKWHPLSESHRPEAAGRLRAQVPVGARTRLHPERPERRSNYTCQHQSDDLGLAA